MHVAAMVIITMNDPTFAGKNDKYLRRFERRFVQALYLALERPDERMLDKDHAGLWIIEEALATTHWA